MFTLFSVLKNININKEDFNLLYESDERCYYIAKDFLEHYMIDYPETNNKDIFLEELKLATSLQDFNHKVSLWLDISETMIIDLTIEEVELFSNLYGMKDSKDLFLNLGKKEEGDNKSIGEIIFVNSLIDLIGRERLNVKK